MRYRFSLDGLLTAAMLLTTAVVAWMFIFGPALASWDSRHHVRATGPVSLSALSTLGSRSSVVLIEFSDFQCPFCVKFALETFPILRHEYVDNGRVEFKFSNLAATRIHPLAGQAARASECANEQGLFGPMHDRLFERAGQFGNETFSIIANGLQLNASRFDTCMMSRANQLLHDQAEDAARLGITSTPTFVFARRDAQGNLNLDGAIVGAQPIGVFRKKLNAMLGS